MTAPTLIVSPIAADHLGIAALREEAARGGYRFVDRLVAEWESGANRFDRPGECLLGAVADGRVVGVGGLNRDVDGTGGVVGRLRHLYVLRSARGRGVGASLVAGLAERARPHFARLRLRTDAADAAAFYLSLGFEPVAEAGATHAFRLGKARPAACDGPCSSAR